MECTLLYSPFPLPLRPPAVRGVALPALLGPKSGPGVGQAPVEMRRLPGAGRGARGGRWGGGGGACGAAALALAALFALEVLLLRPEVQGQINLMHIPSLTELREGPAPGAGGAAVPREVVRGAGTGAGGAHRGSARGDGVEVGGGSGAQKSPHLETVEARPQVKDGGGTLVAGAQEQKGNDKKATTTATTTKKIKKKNKNKNKKNKERKGGRGEVGGGGVTGEVEFSVAAEAALKVIVVPHTQKWVSKVTHLIVNQQHPEKGFELDSLPTKDLQVRYGTCAVVGNSGMLRQVRWGAAIDAHDAVFRFNDGPTATFEEFSGSRTTYRLINNKWTRHMADKGDPRGASQENVVLFGVRSRSRLEEIMASTAEDTAVYVMGEEFARFSRRAYQTSQKALSDMRYVEVVGKNQAPSGIEGIFMALELCGKVRVYGFGVGELPAEAALKVPYHYHDAIQPDEGAHSFSFQTEFLKVMEYSGHVTLCGPNLNVGACSGAARGTAAGEVAGGAGLLQRPVGGAAAGGGGAGVAAGTGPAKAWTRAR